MSNTVYDDWFSQQMERIADGVEPTFKAFYQEREANRAAIRQKDAALVQQASQISALNAEVLQLKTTVALRDTEIAALKRRIFELEHPVEPPPPPPATTYDGGRVQVVWPRFNLPLADWKQKIGNETHIHAAVLHADLANKGGEWADILRFLGDKNVLRYAYFRLPHVRHTAGTTSPFEHQHRLLVERKDAFLYSTAGTPMLHPSGADAYTVPWLIASELADLVLNMVWNSGLYDGLYCDGLTGPNQIYVNDPGSADYDRDGKADVQTVGYAAVARMQFVAFTVFTSRFQGINIVGNDSWTPEYISVTGTPGTSRWRYTVPTTRRPSPWISRIHGAMSEDQTHPLYVNARTDQQAPGLPDETLDMHWRAAADWVSAGKEFWLGGKYRLFGRDATGKPIGLPDEQAAKFLITSALCLGGYVARDAAHPWLALNLGKPLSTPAFSNTTNWGKGVMTRDFEGGRVTCDAIKMTGEITT